MSLLSLTSPRSLCLHRSPWGYTPVRLIGDWVLQMREDRGKRILFDLWSRNAEEYRVTLVLYSLARDLCEVTGLLPFPWGSCLHAVHVSRQFSADSWQSAKFSSVACRWVSRREISCSCKVQWSCRQGSTWQSHLTVPTPPKFRGTIGQPWSRQCQPGSCGCPRASVVQLPVLCFGFLVRIAAALGWSIYWVVSARTFSV